MSGDGDLFGDVSTVDTGVRSDFDFYETPAWMTRSLLYFAPELNGATVLECCSGRDAITNVLRVAGCTVYTNDFDQRQPSMMHVDARVEKEWAKMIGEFGLIDWVISNPPYNEAFDIVTLATQFAQRGVIMLLRKTWKEPTEERGQWLFENTPTREVGEPRHQFRGTGSDSCACDWMIWDRDRQARRSYIDNFAKTRIRWRARASSR